MNVEFIRLNYLYRDFGNYKKHNSVIFSNPSRLTIEEIEPELRKHLLEDTWFIHSHWNLPDLHFEKIDWEQDHAYHEFVALEYVKESMKTDIITIDSFLKKLNSEFSSHF